MSEPHPSHRWKWGGRAGPKQELGAVDWEGDMDTGEAADGDP